MEEKANSPRVKDEAPEMQRGVAEAQEPRPWERGRACARALCTARLHSACASLSRRGRTLLPQLRPQKGGGGWGLAETLALSARRPLINAV